MPTVGFEPTISAVERPQTYALDREAAGTGHNSYNNYYYYRYSALGPVWAETRAQSGAWYACGKLHPVHILRGSLPLLSPQLL
jgi:hypothetical protein